MEIFYIMHVDIDIWLIEAVFSSLSLEPVASASIGQVYRGTYIMERCPSTSTANVSNIIKKLLCVVYFYFKVRRLHIVYLPTKAIYYLIR